MAGVTRPADIIAIAKITRPEAGLAIRLHTAAILLSTANLNYTILSTVEIGAA
jgi:hypothetical protein